MNVVLRLMEAAVEFLCWVVVGGGVCAVIFVSVNILIRQELCSQISSLDTFDLRLVHFSKLVQIGSLTAAAEMFGNFGGLTIVPRKNVTFEG